MDAYKLSAIVEKDGSWYVAHCPEPLVSSQGKTVEEALNNLKEALSLYIKHAEPDELAHLKKAHMEAPLVTTLSVS